MAISEELVSGFFWGLAIGSFIPALACRWWAADSHKRSMETYDRALDLLSDRFDLFREVHTAAMDKIRDGKEPT